MDRVREVSPAIDPKSSTVRVKVAIQSPPAAMALGSAVAGTAKAKPVAQIAVPWTALMSLGSKPAVWIVDPATKTASLQTVEIGSYEAGAVVVKAGLEPGERIVIDGGKLLSSGEARDRSRGSLMMRAIVIVGILPAALLEAACHQQTAGARARPTGIVDRHRGHRDEQRRSRRHRGTPVQDGSQFPRPRASHRPPVNVGDSGRAWRNCRRDRSHRARTGRSSAKADLSRNQAQLANASATEATSTDTDRDRHDEQGNLGQRGAGPSRRRKHRWLVPGRTSRRRSSSSVMRK